LHNNNGSSPAFDPPFAQVLLQAFKYYLQWEDERIFGHPCFGALQQDLSIPRAAAESETARHQKWTQASRFWMPSLELPGKAAGTSTWDDVADVQLLQSHPWRGNIGPNWASRPVNPVSTQGPVNASGIVYPSTSSAGNSTQMCTSCIMREAEKEVKVRATTAQHPAAYALPRARLRAEIVFAADAGPDVDVRLLCAAPTASANRTAATAKHKPHARLRAR
jgi:hypothetical protein